MKKFTKLVLCILVSYGASAQITTPRPSPAGSVSSTVGLTDVTIDYFRPKVRGRMIFGSGDDYLLQYGELWRTGANTGTTITLSTKATIGGTEVEAGKYMILSVPGESEWEFILYSDPSVGGNMANIEEDKKVLSAKVPRVKLSEQVQSMTFAISDISDDNTQANIQFSWADASFKVPIVVSYEEMVMKDIAEKTSVRPGNLMAAATYYLDNGKDLNQALEWVNAYLAIEENSTQFWNVHRKAKILAGLDRKKEAQKVAEASLEAAKSAENDFGYIKLNEDLLAELKGK